MSKKAQINQIFVYLASLLIVVFIAFLVGKFIISFTGDTETLKEVKVFDTLERDYRSVFATYLAEEVYDYRVSSQVVSICFVKDSLKCDIENYQDQLELAFEGGDNVFVFGEQGILSSKSLGVFFIEKGCFCLKPENGRFSLVWENKRNQVWISDAK